jgi:KUP system potassium uptake protein
LIMRADNHGEGGILALLALISPRRAKQSRRRAIMIVIGLIGACLLYGDGAITPAISVLSAIEGIKVYAPQLDRAVVPLTVVILVFLFIIQSKGTSWIGRLFGPVMLVWFVVIGVLGIVGIVRSPDTRRFESDTGDHLSLAWWSARFCGGWRGIPGSHRRRGNVR